MAYKTYFNYFKSLNFCFGVPKTDICEFCTECNQKLKLDSKDSCQIDYMILKKKTERYMHLKNKIIERSKNDHSYLDMNSTMAKIFL